MEYRQATLVDCYRATPGLTLLAGATFVNWFAFFAFCMYTGGDALGINPAADGFILKDHGRRTLVPEGVWLINLAYAYATFASFPVILGTFAVRHCERLTSTSPWLIGTLFFIWTIPWYYATTDSLITSLQGYWSLAAQ